MANCSVMRILVSAISVNLVSAEFTSKCLRGYDNDLLANMNKEVTLCSDHAGMTCCGLNDDRKILQHVYNLKSKSDAPLDCIEAT